MTRTTETAQISIISVSHLEMEEIKHHFDFTQMPNKEIIIEINDDDFPELQAIITDFEVDMSIGYIIFHTNQ